jgi:hypothetical protein
MARRFEISSEINRQNRRFNAAGTQLTVRLQPPKPEENPVNHFLASVNELFEYVLRDSSDSDMVGITIRNEVNENDKVIGLSFRRRDQLSADVIWSVFEKVSQSNSAFKALDRLVVTVHSVRMPVGFGRRDALKTMGRPISVMAHLKRSILEVKAADNCLAHAILIAIARVNNDSNYNAYRKGRKIRPAVENLLETTGIDLSKGAGIPELARFQEYFCDYKIVVYRGPNCDNIMFEGTVESPKRLNLLYDDVQRHYHVITSLTGAMARRYVCKACNKGCKRDASHVCDQTCSDCMMSPACAFEGVRIPCDACNRHFRSQSCFDKHLKREGGRKTVCERKRCCVTCGALVTRGNHEFYKRFCETCKRNKEVGHLCYMKPLKDKSPPSDGVLYVFYDFENDPKH